MKKYDDNLFKMGEITKILGVTRKTFLVYENMGLLTPAVKDEQSGYRYYTADNMTQIRSIRSLQTLGLSLTEIAEYYYDTQNLDEVISDDACCVLFDGHGHLVALDRPDCAPFGNLFQDGLISLLQQAYPKSAPASFQ